MSSPRVRLRGIYATALTATLDQHVEVVQATPPIEARFDLAFPVVEHDVAIATTADRLGVGLHGAPDTVPAIRRRLTDSGIDVLSWADPTPRGALFDATVTDTLGSGAVVDLGPRDGFLPYDAVSDHVNVGDERRLQVHEPAPPWSDRRPELGESYRVPGGLLTLVRGLDGPQADVADEDRATELVRSVDLLSMPVPEGWGVRFEPAAAAADLEALDAALETATDRYEAFCTHRDGGDPPEATSWIRFGRDSRFTLDDCRRTVTPTIDGHHRIKAGGDPASAAVDLVERIASDADPAFDFEAVADTFGPTAGDRLRIAHGKPDGRQFTLGRGVVVERSGDTVTLRREISGGGQYDGLDVPRAAGDVATTTLVEGRWWYPTVYRDAAGELKGTYVNVCTPVEVFPAAAVYVDLHIDVLKHADGRVERVDDTELGTAVEAGHVDEALAGKARSVAASIERGLR